jgi:hypothetical protein
MPWGLVLMLDAFAGWLLDICSYVTDEFADPTGGLTPVLAGWLYSLAWFGCCFGGWCLVKAFGSRVEKSGEPRNAADSR